MMARFIRTTAAVAAAASVPSSFTSMNALWTTFETLSGSFPSSKSGNSAESVNIRPMPSSVKSSLRSSENSILNLGRKTSTSCLCSWEVISARLRLGSFSSSAASPSRSLGSSTSIVTSLPL
uniref:Putative secreted protein n=1 Tax=Anopheles marajoara TaxID=58244 RepID=A0A2M4C7A5_9DIPT